MPAAGRQRAHPALQVCQALLQHVAGGVHDAGVDVTHLLEGEEIGRVLRVAELVAGGLVDRHRPAARRGIGLLAGVQLAGGETELMRVWHGDILVLGIGYWVLGIAKNKTPPHLTTRGRWQRTPGAVRCCSTKNPHSGDEQDRITFLSSSRSNLPELAPWIGGLVDWWIGGLVGWWQVAAHRADHQFTNLPVYQFTSLPVYQHLVAEASQGRSLCLSG